LGVSINTFASQTGDSAQQLMSNAQQQGLGKVDQAMRGIQETSSGAGKVLKDAAS
jgi:glycerate kinase